MFVATPTRARGTSTRAGGASRSALTAFVSAANIFSLAALTHYLLHHNVAKRPAS